MDTYTYWLQGFIYYDDATLAEKSKTYKKSVIFFLENQRKARKFNRFR
jgi:hypothetical protein